MRRIRHDLAQENAQRVKHLRDGRKPHLYVQQFAPLRRDQIEDAVRGARQRDGAHQQHGHDHIGKQGQKVGRFAGALNACANVWLRLELLSIYDING